MSRVCDICRRPGADLDPRELLPGIDVRQHRLLDRAIHARCYARWVHRDHFAAEFHDAARLARRPELTLARDGTVHEGDPPFRPFEAFRDGLVERLHLIPFRGEGCIAGMLHYRLVLRDVAAPLLLALFLAGIGTFISLAVWPVGLLVGVMLIVVAWILAAYVWRWWRMLVPASPRANEPNGAMERAPRACTSSALAVSRSRMVSRSSMDSTGHPRLARLYAPWGRVFVEDPCPREGRPEARAWQDLEPLKSWGIGQPSRRCRPASRTRRGLAIDSPSPSRSATAL